MKGRYEIQKKKTHRKLAMNLTVLIKEIIQNIKMFHVGPIFLGREATANKFLTFKFTNVH